MFFEHLFDSLTKAEVLLLISSRAHPGHLFHIGAD
jgi:hypothetical protein